jgi:sortase B
MKHNRYKGKYTARRRKTPLWLWLFPLVLLMIGLMAIASILWKQHTERAAFAQMAAAVQEMEETVPVAETTLPPEIPVTTAATESAPTVETTQATEPEPTDPLPQYQELFAENPDMAGWLRIDGTAIDYPVMHTPKDPEKYLHLSFQGEYSYAGVPFIDYRCTEDSDNLVIYGHNMSDGSMFNSLTSYEREQYWKDHPVVRFDSVYREREYEVVAAFYDRVYYTHENVFKFYNFIDAADEAEYNSAVEQFKKKSLYDTGVTPQYGQQLITLVTCTYQVENGRFVVVAREKPAS